MTFDERKSDAQQHVHPTGQGGARSNRLQFGIVPALMTEKASDRVTMAAQEIVDLPVAAAVAVKPLRAQPDVEAAHPPGERQ
jgi:hypothetical protein